MHSDAASSLAEVSAEAFAHLAFLFVDASAPGGEVAADADGVAVVAFSGPLTGALLVQVSRRVLPALTATMLGTDATPDVDTQRDALGELANIMTGNVLPRLAGTQAVFTLAPPARYASWDEACRAHRAPDAHVALAVEGGRADVAIGYVQSS
jgi:CheY-specific phosphatase CheX